MQIYSSARTAVDWGASELLAAFPELADIEVSATDQKELDVLLRKLGDNVDAFFKYFPNTASVEEVRQECFDAGGRLLARSDRNYGYLMLAHLEQEAGLREYRTDNKGNPMGQSGLERGFMLTMMFAGSTLHFHPSHQAGSRFRYLGMASKAKAHVIAFAQRPDTAKTAGYLRLPDRGIVILIQGLAWVDPRNFQIVRMHTELLAPRGDVGLRKQSTEIQFSEVVLPKVSRSFWLPLQVIVAINYQGSLYRNRHRYKEYKLFTVETFEKIIRPATW